LAKVIGHARQGKQQSIATKSLDELEDAVSNGSLSLFHLEN
jgi:hypothetical protein